jgi:hypothetical protein
MFPHLPAAASTEEDGRMTLAVDQLARTADRPHASRGPGPIGPDRREIEVEPWPESEPVREPVPELEPEPLE